jgi:hypothetical protein
MTPLMLRITSNPEATCLGVPHMSNIPENQSLSRFFTDNKEITAIFALKRPK